MSSAGRGAAGETALVMRIVLFFLVLFSAGLGTLYLVRQQDDVPIDTQRSYLSDEKRLELFDLERADLLLSRSLKPFLAGIKAGDEAQIREALAPGFQARVPELPPGAEGPEEGKFLHHEILEGRTELDGSGFVRWLLDLTMRFDRIQAVSFGRYENSPEIIQGPNALAQSMGAFRIAGELKGGGLLEFSGTFRMKHAGYARFQGKDTADAEKEDEKLELPGHFLHGIEFPEAALVSSVGPVFRDVTASCGVTVAQLHDNWTDDPKNPDIVFTGGCYLGDVNGDGHLDLLVGEIYHSALYFGQGDGTFVDSGWKPPVAGVPGVKREIGAQADQRGEQVVRAVEPQAALFDADNDGTLDVLYCGLFYRWNPRKQRMAQVQGATRLPLADAALCDYDGDGLVDLYFLNSGAKPRKVDHAKYKSWFDNEGLTGAANQLFRNLGDFRFEDVSKTAIPVPWYGRTFAAAWFYANDDDWPDLFGAHEFGRNLFVSNNGDGTFRWEEDVDPVFGGFSMGVSSGDIDGDGRADLYVSNMYSKAGQRVYSHLDLSVYPESARKMFMHSVKGNRLYRSHGDMTFDDLTAFAGGNAVGWAWSGAMFDVDLDGWLDVYAPCGYRSLDASKPDG